MNALIAILKTPVAYLAIALPLLVLTGCGSSEECTMMGCQDELLLAFPQNLPEEGDWRFVIHADDKVGTCTVALPGEGERSGSCDGVDFEIRYKRHPESERLVPEGIAFRGAPSNVVIAIEAPSRASSMQTLSPAYRDNAPNGRECGPICKSASGTLSLKP